MPGSVGQVVATLGKVAVKKTLESRRPVALPPGQYTVILEASAVADLLGSGQVRLENDGQFRRARVCQ